MRRRFVVSLFAALCTAEACQPSGARDTLFALDDGGAVTAAGDAAMLPATTGSTAARGSAPLPRLHNRVAYIPPQCFTNTRGADGKPKNPCYACHTHSEPPNFVDDEDLQLTLTLPVPAWKNPWTPVDETALGVDLDLDGRLGRATRVVFDAAADGRGGTRMHYAGRARDLERRGGFPIAPGLFPLHTEFFHTVRYLDVGSDGAVTMAARMKEVRYARKDRWLSYDEVEAHVGLEKFATMSSVERTHGVLWLGESGVSNEQGWYFQGFIEARDGALRPQSMDESAFCEGCHGGIGATTDGIFSFPRKLGDKAPARGWFHWSQHSLRGLPEPRRRDGQFEYTLYLREAGAGDELRSNAEVSSRFFDDQGALRPGEVARLHTDIARLLLPSPARALDLDRAYRAVVLDQSFEHGRDAVLAVSPNVQATPLLGEKTGIIHPVVAMGLAR
jgi:hypothetical protein